MTFPRHIYYADYFYYQVIYPLLCVVLLATAKYALNNKSGCDASQLALKQLTLVHT